MIAEEKQNALIQNLNRYQNILIAYSGGTDSAFLAWVCKEALGKKKVLAVTGISPSISRNTRRAARNAMNAAKIPWKPLRTYEFRDPLYLKNNPRRCFHCKNELFSRLTHYAKKNLFEVVVEGSNEDDHSDIRPGLEAAKKHDIKSPLQEVHLSKKEIRFLSHKARLITWDLPSSPCLSSRIPFGEKVNAEKTKQISLAEDGLRLLGFSSFRVRHHGQAARIELNEEDLIKVIKNGLKIKVIHAVKKAGFQFVSVDLEGYRKSGLSGQKK